MRSLDIPLFKSVVSFLLVGASLSVVSIYIMSPVAAEDPLPMETAPEPLPLVKSEPEPESPPEEEELVVEASLLGTLRDLDTGAPIRNRLIEVQATSPSDPGSPVKAVVDPSTGTFTFSALKLCPYQVMALAEGYLPVWDEVVPPLASQMELLLPPAGEVRIRVTDRYARRLKNITFREKARKNPEAPETLSYRFEEGYFLVRGLHLGSQELVVEAEGFKSVCVNTHVDRNVVHTYWAVFE